MAYERSERLIHPPIPVWSQDTYQETYNDLNKIIETKYVFFII